MAAEFDLSKIKSGLSSQGFFHCRQVLDQKVVEQVQADAKRVFATQLSRAGIKLPTANNETDFSEVLFQLFKDHESRFIAAGKLCQNLISLHQLSLSEPVLQLVRAAGLEFPTISTRPTMFFNSRHLAKSQGYWKTPPHQDWRSIQGSLNCVVVWIPLLDIDKELGTLEIVPGSHKDGLLSSTEDDFYRTVGNDKYPESAFESVEVQRGDCLIFSSFLVHRSGTNSTDRVRWSCHFRYNDMCEKTFVERNFPNPYVYKPQQELITPDFPRIEHLRDLFS